MSPLVMIIYELVYSILYLGLLFSKNTLFSLFPDPSMLQRLVFFFVISSGFALPFVLQKLKIMLRKQHYLITALVLCCIYIYCSYDYYDKEIMNRRFHPYLQIPPRTQQATIPKPESKYRIVCLGGSTTEGKADANYPAFLESLLRKRYPEKNIEVLNSGKYFYNSQSSIIQYLFYLKEFEPDLIIFFHGFNDIMTSFTGGKMASTPFRKDYGHFYGPLGKLRYPVLFENYLEDFFFSDFTAPEPQTVPFSNFQSLPSYKRNLETIIDLARLDNISLIFSSQAHRFSPKGDSPARILGLTRPFLTKDKHRADEKSWYMAMKLFNKTTAETANRLGVPYVDQATLFKGKHDLFTDCVHMTPEGTTKKANLFFKKIVDLELLE